MTLEQKVQKAKEEFSKLDIEVLYGCRKPEDVISLTESVIESLEDILRGYKKIDVDIEHKKSVNRNYDQGYYVQ